MGSSDLWYQSTGRTEHRPVQAASVIAVMHLPSATTSEQVSVETSERSRCGGEKMPLLLEAPWTPPSTAPPCKLSVAGATRSLSLPAAPHSAPPQGRGHHRRAGESIPGQGTASRGRGHHSRAGDSIPGQDRGSRGRGHHSSAGDTIPGQGTPTRGSSSGQSSCGAGAAHPEPT